MTPENFKAFIAKLEDGIIDQTQPNIIGGSNIAQGRLKGRPLEQAGSGFCNSAHWQAENDIAKCRPLVEFGEFGAQIGYNFYNWNEELIYHDPLKPMRGIPRAGNIAEAVHVALLGIIGRAAMFTAKRLEIAKTDGVEPKDVDFERVLKGCSS